MSNSQLMVRAKKLTLIGLNGAYRNGLIDIRIHNAPTTDFPGTLPASTVYFKWQFSTAPSFLTVGDEIIVSQANNSNYNTGSTSGPSAAGNPAGPVKWTVNRVNAAKTEFLTDWNFWGYGRPHLATGEINTTLDLSVKSSVGYLFPADSCVWQNASYDTATGSYKIEGARHIDGNTSTGIEIADAELGYISKTGRFIKITDVK